MAIDPTAASSVSGAYRATGTKKAEEKTDIFSSDGFLRLLAQEMKSQNPLEPMKDSEYVAQMAQFSQLEQITALNTTMQTFNLTSQLTQGSSLIGRQVTYTPEAEGAAPVTGTVERLLVADDGRRIALVVGGVTIDPARITEVTGA
jgi:flagellar basal-body rod modification protein FlgD